MRAALLAENAERSQASRLQRSDRVFLALRGRLAIPFDGDRRVLGHTLTLLVRKAQVVLRTRNDKEGG